MTKAEEHKSDGIGKDLVVYVCLLALAGLQFLIAYQNIDITQKFVRMLAVAIVEAGLAGFFFLHLFEDKRGFFLFFFLFFYFLLLRVEYVWTVNFPDPGWTGPARCPSPGLLPELLALLYAGGLRRYSDDSGIAQRHSDPHRPSHVHVGWHDLHHASQA